MNNNGLSGEKEPAFENLFTERQEFGKSFITFLENSEDEDRVISIDADWGFGKTTFMTELNKGLIKKNFTVFTYNAWENDFETDPLKCFISELIPQMMKAVGYNKESDTKKEEIVKNVLVGANEILNALTKIDILTFKKNLNEKKETLNKLLGENKSDLQIYENISPLSKAQKQFKIRLNEIYNEIENQKDEANKNKKIVILIDELDRCRPTFAVELLERVKHLFNTPNYVFVFTVCAKQLKESVKQIYGNGYEETGYFRRFFDYEFYLPEPDKIEYFKQYINGNSLFKKAFEYIKDFEFSLRDYDKIINFIKLIIKLNKTDYEIQEASYLAFGIMVKFLDANLFKDLYNNTTINIDFNKYKTTKEKIESIFIIKYNTNEGIENNLLFPTWISFIKKLKYSKNNRKIIYSPYYSFHTQTNNDISENFIIYTDKEIISDKQVYVADFDNKKMNQILLFVANQLDESEGH